MWEQQIHRCYLNARHTNLRLSVPQGTRADLGRKETSQEKRTFFTFYSTHKCNLSCLVCASRHQTTLQSIPSPCSRAFNLFLYEIWKKYLVFLLINHESLKKNSNTTFQDFCSLAMNAWMRHWEAALGHVWKIWLLWGIGQKNFELLGHHVLLIWEFPISSYGIVWRKWCR